MPSLIRLPLNGKTLLFVFGPYRERFPGTYGVRLTEDGQLNLPCDFHFPIRDFDVPTPQEFQAALIRVIGLAVKGEVPYVGCFGGIGRTGMFAAGLVRVLKDVTGPEAVQWVRANYLGHAVETKAQHALIANFDADAVRAAVGYGAPKKAPPKNNLQLAALWGSFKEAVFGSARRQASDDPRKS